MAQSEHEHGAERCPLFGSEADIGWRRGDKPSDAKVWRQLLTYAPPWTVMEAAFRIRTQRRK
jgi:hypothetical protein